MRKPFIAAAVMLGVATTPFLSIPAYATAKASESSTSINIEINGTKISITAPGNGKPVITTNGETVTPPKENPKPTPSATPTSPPSDDTQDDEIAGQQAEQGAPAASLDDALFDETNKFRALPENGSLPPFERDTCLDGTAGEKSKLLIETGTFEHGDLGPASQECGTSVGENIAYTTYGDPSVIAHEFVFDIWANSTEGHREAMLSTEYTHMGVDVTDNGDGFHATQHFATRDEPGPAEPASAEAPAETPAEAPPTGLKAEQGLTPAATNLIRVVHQKWPALEIGGVRQDSLPYHPSGRALDIMTGDNSCAPVGQEIADWAKDNAAKLGVDHIIWCGKIWNPQRADEGWRPASGHNDHVHITVNDGKTA